MTEEERINEVKKEEQLVDEVDESVQDGTHTSETGVNGEPAPVATPIEETEKMIPQSEVNNIVGRTRMEAREKARAEYLAEILAKYGLADEAEMDGVFGKGQQYDVLNEDYNNQSNEFTAMREENALLKSEVTPEKWEDARLIIRGKGLQVTPETISSELATHPEWLKKANVVQSQGTEKVKPMLEVLGDETNNKPKEPSEEEIVNKWFGV